MVAALERRRASQEFAIAFMRAQHMMRELTREEKLQLQQTKKRLDQTLLDLKAWRLIPAVLAMVFMVGCGEAHSCDPGKTREYVDQVGGCDFAGNCRVTLPGPRTAISNLPTPQAHNCVWNIEGGTL